MKTYWWKGSQYLNLGDEVTQLVLKNLFNIDPVHADLTRAQFASTGSLLGWIWETDARLRDSPLHVVGSGFMSSDTVVTPLDFLKIHSVRGYLSRNNLGKLDSNKILVGDPCLLVPRIINQLPAVSAPSTKYGVILHHKHAASQEVLDRFSHLPVKFLDIRTADLATFAGEMASCDVIVSQSLHGLIFADALNIPNVWLELGPIHSGGAFKFYDYFSTIGREFYRKISFIPQAPDRIDAQIHQPNAKRVASISDQAFRSFENALSDYNKN